MKNKDEDIIFWILNVTGHTRFIKLKTTIAHKRLLGKTSNDNKGGSFPFYNIN